ncbi:amidohydrolase family protein [Listeria costaricensis]|uniref:amidohydrolase family protein n=1 Tax=Listeria costaricensis TaxID=2026604 RepID=UPI000C08AA21|nr:amidohydrolase family protein [Listeria costaricensis]
MASYQPKKEWRGRTKIADIQTFVDQIHMIDVHEHLPTQAMRAKDQVGFFDLMHYLDSDFVSVGADREALKRFSALEKKEKAAYFLTYYKKCSNTHYAKLLKKALEDLYDFNDWSVEGILALDERITAFSKDPELYQKVLVDKAKIDLAITLIITTNVNLDYFLPVLFYDDYFHVRCAEDLHKLEKETAEQVSDFSAYLALIDKVMEQHIVAGCPAIKLGHAYFRTLEMTEPCLEKSEKVFLMMKNKQEALLKEDDYRTFEDTLIHHIIQKAAAHDLPIQIHTGLQETSVSGDGNDLRHARAAHLIPLFLKYPQARFVLLHASTPYIYEYAAIVKNFPNVYADMTWTYGISPSLAEQALELLTDMVPQTKIFGFGGDYNHIEGTYAVSKVARQVLAKVLKRRIETGYFSEEEAKNFALHIFRNNAIDFYKLNGLEKGAVL